MRTQQVYRTAGWGSGAAPTRMEASDPLLPLYHGLLCAPEPIPFNLVGTSRLTYVPNRPACLTTAVCGDQ